MAITPLHFSDRLGPQFGQIHNLSEGLLDVFGTSRRVDLLKQTVSPSSKQNWKITALKVVAWIGSGLILPLLALAVKAVVRVTHRAQLKAVKLTSTTVSLPPCVQKHSFGTQTDPTDLLPSKKELIKRLNSGEISLLDLDLTTMDDVLTFLDANRRNIEHLNLTCFCGELKDEHLEAIADIFADPDTPKARLKSLTIHGAESITIEGYQGIGELTSLEKLSLNFSNVSDKCLSELKSLTNLRELSLNNCNITSNGLYWALMDNKVIESLSVKECGKVNDHFISWLAEKGCLSLRNLDIRRCYQFKEAGLLKLKEFPHLQNLSLSGKALTEKGLLSLSGLPNLRELLIQSVSSEEADALESLKHFQHLSKLTLRNCHASDDQLECLSNLENLDSLCVTGMCASGSFLTGLKKMTKLKTLQLSAQNFGKNKQQLTDDHLAYLSHLTSLESLTLEGHKFVGDGFHNLKGLKNLHHLDLNNCNSVGQSILEPLKAFKKLKTLNLHLEKLPSDVDNSISMLTELNELSLHFNTWEQIPKDFFQFLKKTKKLKVLSIQGLGSDHELQHFSNLKQLKSLSFSSCNGLTADGFKVLPKLEELENLEIHGNSMFNQAIAYYIQKLPKLKRLSLLHTKHINDAVLFLVSKVGTLEHLVLNIPKGQSGFSVEGLDYLTQCHHLKSLDLGSCPFKVNDMKPLSSLPKLKVLIQYFGAISDAQYDKMTAMFPLWDSQFDPFNPDL